MNILNASYPHRDHILINNGIPGSNYQFYSDGACLENLLPTSPDLIIVEHLPYLDWSYNGSLLHLERMAYRLQLSFTNRTAFPAFIFISMLSFIDEFNARGPFFNNASICVHSRGDPIQCSKYCPTMFVGLPRKNSSLTPSELATKLAAGQLTLGSQMIKHGILTQFSSMLV